MNRFLWILILVFGSFIHLAYAQVVTFSDVDEDDSKEMKFVIIGKLNGNIHIYKKIRDAHYMVLYNATMQQTSKNKLDFLPKNTTNETFLLYPDYYCFFYEFEKKSIIYLMLAKFDNTGKKMGEPIQIDTTSTNSSENTKIYSVINSEDKSKIAVVKVSAIENKTITVNEFLFDKDFNVLDKSKINVQMAERNSKLSEFSIDNDGDFNFVRTSGSGSTDITTKVSLITKKLFNETAQLKELNLNGNYLDDIKMKIDNYNKHILLTTLYSKQRGGNVEGFFCYLWDKNIQKEILNTNLTFSEDFRADAKDENSIKTALNEYYLKNVVMKQDGGFMITAEAAYQTTSSVDPYNRWNSFGGFGGYSGMYNNPYNRVYNNVTHYFADNVIMFSVDITGKMEWSNVIRKSQQDDNTEDRISYNIANSGDKIHFIFNMQSKRGDYLTEQTISPEGQLVRSPGFKVMEKGYEFMPRHGKQTGIRQIVVPCLYRSYICFSKIDF